MTTRLYTHPACLEHDTGPRHPERSDRLRAVLRALEDEAFAGDRGARYLWWYKRTPYWDDTVGLMPVMRLMAPADFSLACWPE